MTTRERLFSLEQFGIKLGLEQISALLSHLGHPEHQFVSLTVAGTNGKGSVTAMLERGLRAAGYRTGRYTSPHLVHLEERVAIDGASIDADRLDRAAERVLAAAQSLPAPPSFFEATTALAIDVFREADIDVAVLEVGLGGRLDATNAVDSIGAAITRIDFDHQQYLGDTLPAIAAEKAAVIKPGATVVVGANPPEVIDVVSHRCDDVGATLTRAASDVATTVTLWDGRAELPLRTPRRDHGVLRLALRGRHQAENASIAACLLDELDAEKRLVVPAAAVKTALEQAAWPGRLELVHWKGMDVLLDGAHNASGARALASYIRDVHGGKMPMVVGLMKDKDAAAILGALVDVASRIVLTAADTPRAARPEWLENIVRSLAPELPTSTSDDSLAALRLAARDGSATVVAGSLYLVGEVRAQLS